MSTDTDQERSIEVRVTWQPNWRKILFELHGWIGLDLGLIYSLYACPELSPRYLMKSVRVDPARSVDTRRVTQLIRLDCDDVQSRNLVSDGIIQTICGHRSPNGLRHDCCCVRGGTQRGNEKGLG